MAEQVKLTQLDIDGKNGPNTKKASQQFLKDNGFNIAVDGIWGKGYYTALQKFLLSQGYKIGVDGIPGPQTYTALQQFLQKSNKSKIGVDGKLGPGTIKQLQIFLSNYFSNACNAQSADEKQNDSLCIWTKSVQKTLNFTEDTEEGDIKIPVGKIAQLVAVGIGAGASGGTLGPILAKQLEDAVVNISWSDTTKHEKSTENFFDQNTYLFLEMIRNVQSKSKGFGFGSNKTYNIEVNVKYMYLEAGNDAAMKQLSVLQQKKVNEAFEYIGKRISWQ